MPCFRGPSANISILSNFGQLFSNCFLDIEKFFQMLSTCQVSDQLDHSNKNCGGGGENLTPAIPICKKSGLFRVKILDAVFYSLFILLKIQPTSVSIRGPDDSNILYFEQIF